MKRFLLPLLLFLGMNAVSMAQDTITKTSGEAIKAKVLEITPGEVKYKSYENQTGPTYVLSKADVLLIEYENKTSEVFPKEQLAEDKNVSSSSNVKGDINMYAKGQSDAMFYYKEYKGAGTGTLVATLISPIGGLVTAIACSSTTPKAYNLNYPDQNLMQDYQYTRGFKEEAKRKKSGKVWKNFGIAMAVNVAAILLIASQGQ